MGKKENQDSQSVKRLRSIGAGGEARVYLEVRSFFPGIGWDIYTTQRVKCANREGHTPDGHRNFLRHAIIKKLDDYFISLGKYRDIHIPRPLGSTDKGYVYQFEQGSDCFSWQEYDEGKWVPVRLEEWGSFVGAFSNAGVDLRSDIADVDDGRMSQNIILNHPYELDPSTFSLGSLWKRIDFGSGSISFNYDKLEKFLSENKEKLMIELSARRYEFMNLALQYLKPGPEHMDKRDIGRLEILAGDFRISTLSEFNKRGSSKDFSKKRGVYPTEQRIG